jgi:hypothetical protein
MMFVCFVKVLDLLCDFGFLDFVMVSAALQVNVQLGKRTKM